MVKAPRQESTFEPAPEGTHVARCYRFIQIGTVDEEYMGEAKKMHKIFLSFELPNETKVFKEGDEPKPVSISQEYTLSMGAKSNLRKLIQGVFGSMTDEEAFEFDIDKIVGKPCLINIVHKTAKTSGRVRAEIASASSLVKGMEAPDAFNDKVVLSYENWNEETFESLPDFLKEKIRSSDEYRTLKGLNPEDTGSQEMWVDEDGNPVPFDV